MNRLLEQKQILRIVILALLLAGFWNTCDLELCFGSDGHIAVETPSKDCCDECIPQNSIKNDDLDTKTINRISTEHSCNVCTDIVIPHGDDAANLDSAPKKKKSNPLKRALNFFESAPTFSDLGMGTNALLQPLSQCSPTTKLLCTTILLI